ncbi:MAG: hypothetical protein QOI20_2566 [Acidimicrobiaceae bacterium]|nr:hypothetical protein [Acidimicrobiaceae bacterium]
MTDGAAAAMDEPGRPPRPPRLPVLLQAGVVAVVLGVVAAVSLTARQPPPPTVAEYAPQAVSQITQAPVEQSVDPGRGGVQQTTTTTAPGSNGNGVGSSSSTTTTTTRAVIEKPRVRHCVGDPGRQIEDPQSPPCVPYFDPKTSNGGSTWRGVGPDAINVFWTPDFLETNVFVEDMANFFNARFEFYGRKLVMNRQNPRPGDADPTAMQADAQDAYDLASFAALNYSARSGAEYSFYDAAARLKIVSVAHRVQAQATDAHFRRQSPYEWSSVPTVDSMLRNYGQFLCGSLAGRPPKYAGGTTAGAAKRVFGVIVQEAADGSRPDLKPLQDEMARCDASIAATVNDRVTSATGRTGQAVIAAMTDADVTSIICLCDGKELRETIMPAASAQLYEPEWLVGSYLDNDLDNSLNGAPNDQSAHVLGLVFRNKLLAKQDMPFYWALKEANPTSDPQGGAYYSVAARYSSLLVLASGIQMAGPHLTPDTFAAGLLRTRWANPGAGAPPYFQAPAGFDGGRRTFIDDASMFWLDPNRQSTVDPQNTGAVCYVRRGERHRLGDWPTGDQPFFTQPCS